MDELDLMSRRNKSGQEQLRQLTINAGHEELGEDAVGC